MSVTFVRPTMMKLQATLSSASVPSHGGETAVAVEPHHPITCTTELRFEPDGALLCDHAKAPADDQRTRSCLNHSLSLLLMELAQDL